MSKNINTNTAIANIILSDEHEIRLKKKPRRKTSSKKKEALESVKTALKNYDLAVADAKSKNISLPAELGELPVKIEDVNSVKELEELAIKLQSMTSQINQLIAQGASKQRTSGLFNEGMGMASPLRFFPVQPQPIQPNPIEQQPVIRPIQPIVPSSKPIDPTQVKDNDVEQSLDKLQKEILDKLSPEDRAKAEEQMKQEQQQQQQPVEPSDTGAIPESPSIPDQTPTLPNIKPPEKIKDSDLETTLNVKFGNQTIPKLVAPTGFYNFFTDYRRYIENVEFDTILINDGEYKIEKDKYRMLQNQKAQLLKDFDNWEQSLNRQQLQFIDNSQQITSIINEIMDNIDRLDPEDLSKKILQSQNKNIKEFKIGDEETSTEIQAKERLSEEGKKLEQKLKMSKDIINETIVKANKTVKEDELTELINELNLLKVEANKYNRLSGIDQVALEVLHSEVIDSIKEASNEIENKIKEVKQGLPIDPLQELDPSAPVAQPVIPVETEKEKAKKIVNDFVNGKTTYNKKVRDAIRKLPNSDTVFDENELIRNRTQNKKNINKDLKKITKDYLIGNNLLIDEAAGKL